MLRMKDACPQFHIINCTISIFLSLFFRRVVDALGSCFPPPSCLPFAFFCPYYLTILLSLDPVLELGRRLRCREQTAQVLRVSSFYFPPYLLRTLLV